MRKYIVEYKAISYYEAEVVAESEEEAIAIADEMDGGEFTYVDSLDGSWKFSQIIDEGEV